MPLLLGFFDETACYKSVKGLCNSYILCKNPVDIVPAIDVFKCFVYPRRSGACSEGVSMEIVALS